MNKVFTQTIHLTHTHWMTMQHINSNYSSCSCGHSSTQVVLSSSSNSSRCDWPECSYLCLARELCLLNTLLHWSQGNGPSSTSVLGSFHALVRFRCGLSFVVLTAASELEGSSPDSLNSDGRKHWVESKNQRIKLRTINLQNNTWFIFPVSCFDIVETKTMYRWSELKRRKNKTKHTK